MKRIIAALVIVLALSVTALAQPPPHFTATYSLAANADPSGICTNEVRFWINNVTNDMFSCYGGTWYPVGGGAAAFPITDVDGASSVTLSGDATAETGSFLLANATDVAGMNAALGATLGASLFASNATDQASVNIDINAQTITTNYESSFAGGTISNIQVGPATYLAVFTNPDEGTITTHTFGESSELKTEDSGLPGDFGRIYVDISSAMMGVENTATDHARISFSVTQAIQEIRTAGGDYIRTYVQASGPADDTGGAKPTCDAGSRRSRWFTEGGAGVADTYEVCMKDAADAYAWEVVATP